MAKEITAAQRKAVTKYERENYDKVLLRMPKGEREAIKERADAAGVSLNAFILEAARKYGPSSTDSILTPEAIQAAKEEAAKTGEELGDFLARAIKDTSDRDEQIRKTGFQQYFLGHKKGESK